MSVQDDHDVWKASRHQTKVSVPASQKVARKRCLKKLPIATFYPYTPDPWRDEDLFDFASSLALGNLGPAEEPCNTGFNPLHEVD